MKLLELFGIISLISAAVTFFLFGIWFASGRFEKTWYVKLTGWVLLLMSILLTYLVKKL